MEEKKDQLARIWLFFIVAENNVKVIIKGIHQSL